MRIICGWCGADITARACACRPGRAPAQRSTLLDACLLAAALRGHVDADSLAEAARALQEPPS